MALGTTDGYYITGTVAITNNTKALVGTGTAWSTAGIKKGYKFYAGGSGPVIVDTVNSDTSITLLDNWTYGTLSGAYELEAVSTTSALLNAIGYLNSLLVTASLSAFSALTGAADKIGYFTGAGAMALADFGQSAREWLSIGASRAEQLDNLGLALSVSASTLICAVKQADGATDATATKPITIAMRSSTAANGNYNARKITGAQSLTVPSGATLGTSNGVAANLYLYEIDNAGTLELAISGADSGASGIVSTTAISAAATSAAVMYSANARSNVPFRKIGVLVSTQATAGTWAAVPTTATVVAPGGAAESEAFKTLKAGGSYTGNMTIGNGADIAPSGTPTGQLLLSGAGYKGYVALDSAGMHLGHNSSLRNVTVDINSTPVWTLTAGSMQVQGTGYSSYYTLDGTGLHIGHNSSARNLTLELNNTAKLSIGTLGTVSMPTGAFSGEVTLATDTATDFGNVSPNGFSVLFIWQEGTGGQGVCTGVLFRTSSSPNCIYKFGLSTNFVATTGTLTGTTGSAGNITVSAANGHLYLENRQGSTQSFAYIFFRAT